MQCSEDKSHLVPNQKGAVKSPLVIITQCLARATHITNTLSKFTNATPIAFTICLFLLEINATISYHVSTEIEPE